MEESIIKETDDNGNTISEVLGVSRIFDPILLEEIVQYNDQDNFDRIVAAELAIAQALRMDPIFGRMNDGGDERIAALYKRKTKNRLFTESRGMFIRKKHKLFM